MDKIATATKDQRKAIFMDVANKAGLAPYIVEKDFWVSWALGKIFANEELKQILCFKGGTSLSKAYGIIERFSEDIDLILNLSVVLMPDETLNQTSNTKQAAFNEQIEERASTFITGKLKTMIDAALDNICKVETNPDDTHVLHIVFPRLFDYGYIQPNIKLEIGPLALWNPNAEHTITSFVSKMLPELEIQDPVVPTVKAERTFWEKTTILHHEANRPEDATPIQPRYSRHYYDVFKLGHTEIKDLAFANLELLKEVVDFKKQFYPRGWAKYDEAKPGTMKLLPPKHSLDILIADYKNMKNMIYGDMPSWEEIIAFLTELETAINNL